MKQTTSMFNSIAISIAIILFISSCKKEASTPAPTPTPVPTSTIFVREFTGTIDGTVYNYVDGNGTTNIGGGVSSALTGNSVSYYGSYLNYDTSFTQIFNLEKGILNFVGQGVLPTDSAFNNFFALGTYPYTYPYYSSGTNGIHLYWTDQTGTQWSTSNGTADQTGSAFAITVSEPKLVTYISGGITTVKDFVNIKTSFNCKLYNSSGQSKTLTNGSYTGYFIKQ